MWSPFLQKGEITMVLSIEKIMIAGAEKQMTLKDVLKEAHMAKATIKKIKEGKEVTMRTAGKLAAVLEVSVLELVVHRN